MSTAFQLLSSKVELLAQNPVYQESASILLTQGLQMSIDELIEVFHSNSAEIYCLRSLIIFLRYLAEAPKGPAYQHLRDDYIYALGYIPDDCKLYVSPFMSTIYLGALSKELNVQKLSDLEVWLETYEYLKTKNVEIQLFEENLKIKISSKLLEVVINPEKNIKNCTECAISAAFAQRKGLNLSDTVNLFINSIHGYLNTKYEMYNGGGKKNLGEISNLVYYLKNLMLEGDMEKYQVLNLEEFFGASDQIKNNFGSKEENINPNLEYAEIDFTTLNYVCTIYASICNPNFNISIYHYMCSINGNTALKVYDIKNPDYDRKRIMNEIEILEALSSKKTQSSCFINFYGTFWDKTKVYISMEYIKDTLMTKLTEMKQNYEKFTEEHMIYYSRELISAHAEMEEFGIFHQDIKPHNILVTPNWKLKIIDFSVSASKSYDEGTLSATGEHCIQGSQGYMAPELQTQALNSNNVQSKYKPGKADVFSLGLVLLQIHTLEEIHTLNLPESHPKLMRKVESLPYIWFQTLLTNMLQLDYNKRVSFREALNFVPGNRTL